MKKLFVCLLISVSTIVFAQNRSQDRLVYSPRRSTQLVEFKDNLYMIGGVIGQKMFELTSINDVWRTANGMTWERVGRDIVQPPRVGSCVFVFRDKMWLLGGYDAQSDTYLNDIWFTVDGKKWINATDYAEFTGRTRANVVVKGDSIYLLGGVGEDNKPNDTVYVSKNALDWELAAEEVEFATGEDNQAIVYNDEIYVFNPSDGIYTSEDGESWEHVGKSDLLESRRDYAVCVYDGKICLTGGMIYFRNNSYKEYLNDTWVSEDGSNWRQIKHNNIVANQNLDYAKAFRPRGKHSSIAFKNCLYVTAGLDMVDGVDVYLNDTWCTKDASVWIKMR